MTPTLYFLRSSENKIIENILPYAHSELQDTSPYSQFYGLTTKDLGLYALVENTIAGAIWSRELSDDGVATLSLGVLPAFRDKGIESKMMEQFLVEASESIKKIAVDTYGDIQKEAFYKEFGFIMSDENNKMLKNIDKQEIVRPSDGYDPRRWMD